MQPRLAYVRRMADLSGDQLDSSRAAQEEEEEDEFGEATNIWNTGRDAGAQGPVLDIGQLMAGIVRGLAAAGQDTHRGGQESLPARPASAPSTGDERFDPLGAAGARQGQEQAQAAGSGGSNGGFRTGTTRIGPVNVSWGIGSHTAQGGSRSPQAGQHPAMGLGDYVRQSFQEHAQHHVHDDGMGGAGAAADGRFFNHDNDEENRSDDMPGMNSRSEPDLPPELASLRAVFSNLFGGIEEGPAGMLLDLFGGAMRGRSGDYVWGQQGLDDVITQLMDQTRGSSAPPPASDEAIAKLDKFSRKDAEKVRSARNQDCSTCMDSFLDEEEALPHDASKDSNRPVADPESTMDVDDDPPEVVPHDEQQDTLVMMPCRHLFHQDCIVPWLKSSGTCPVCRISLEPQKAAENDAGSSAAPASSSSVSGTAELATNPIRPTSSAAIVEEREDTDVEDEGEDEDSSEQRRERMRRAAEARMHGGGTNLSQHDGSQPRVPGAFMPADDLD